MFENQLILQVALHVITAYTDIPCKHSSFCWPLQNQFFISGLSRDDTIKNRVLEALYRRIIKAEKEKKCFRVIIVIPLLPGFQVM